MRPKWAPGASRRAPGGLFWYPPGALLAGSWGRLGAVLGPSWGHLGAVLGRLGPSWLLLLGNRANFKHLQKTICFYMSFEVFSRLGRDLVAVLGRLGRS